MSLKDFHALFDKPEPQRPVVNVTPIDPEAGSRYARKALQSECENVAAAPEGQRNHTLNRAAFNISQLVAAGHVDEEDARGALHRAAYSVGLSDHEILATLNSGFRAGGQSPRVVPERDELAHPSVTVLEDGTEVVPGDAPPLNQCIDWHVLFSTDDDEEEWIIEPLLPARRMVALYSAPKAGKSLLMLELAVAIATGGPALGTTAEPHRVLYIDFENDPRGDVRARLEAMGVGPDQLDNLRYLSFPSLAKFDSATGAVDLIRHVEAYDCQVVVIDTVSRAVAGEENENDTWLAFYRHTGLALKRAGVACIRLDHTGKDAAKGMRGGSAKYGDVDAVWSLTATEETVVLECTANRMPVPSKSVVLVRKDGPLRHEVNPAVTSRRQADINAVIDDLDALGLPNEATANECEKALQGAGKKHRRQTILAAVKAWKRRPATLPQVVPEPLGNHRNHVGVSGSGGGSYRNHRNHPETGSENAGTSDLLVGCDRCHTPTLASVKERFDGRCASCAREVGDA